MLDYLKEHATEIGQGALILVLAVLAALRRMGGAASGSTPPPQTVAITSDVLVIKNLEMLTAEMGALNFNLVALGKSFASYEAQLGRKVTALEAILEEAKEENHRLEGIKDALIAQRGR